MRNRPRGDYNTEKTREEIKWLRVQRTIAVLAAVGAVAGFAITNLRAIEDIIYTAPKVRILSQDEFVRRNGIVQIRRPTGVTGGWETIHVLHYQDAEDWMRLQEGSYQVAVVVGTEILFTESVFLRRSDKRTVIVAPDDGARIRIHIRSEGAELLPGTVLRLGIDTSGNGFLWVFNRTKGTDYQLIFPAAEASDGNRISVGETFRFPRPDGKGLIAGDELGNEWLLFIITSSSDVEVAQRIARSLGLGVTPKAAFGEIKENWGATEISYKITGPLR
jgi:hypothetical protein